MNYNGLFLLRPLTLLLILSLQVSSVSAEKCPSCRGISLHGPRSWTEMKTENIVMQTYDYSCGAATLATILTYYWNDPTGELDVLIDLENKLTVAELEDRVENGLAITDLKNLAQFRGYRSQIGTLDSIEKLANVKVPVIVAITQKEQNHFVVVRGVIGNYVYLADPLRGNMRMATHEFSDAWVKNALLVVLHPEKNLSTSSRMTIPLREIDPQRAVRPHLQRQLFRELP